MNCCKTCRYWVKPAEDAYEEDDREWGRCFLAQTSDGISQSWKWCENEDRWIVTPLVTLARSVDAERYSAYLQVKPDFGCVQYDPLDQ